MKVAILSFYSGEVERGVEVWAASLKKALEPNCEVEIFSNESLPIDWSQPDNRGSIIRTFFLDYWSRLIAKFTLSSLHKIHKSNPDIIIPTNGGWQSLIIRLYCWVFDKKMVLVGHAGRGFDEIWNLWCFPDYFIGLTSYAARWAKTINPFIYVTIIPNGIWTSEFSPSGSTVKLNLQRPVFLYVSAIERGKRPQLTIEAVTKLNVGSLLMIGSGEKTYRREMEHLGRELLGDRFMMTEVPHSEISKYYRAADVFTLATGSQEAFGIVYLEALSSGLPIVTTNDQIKKEILKENAIYVNPTNTDEYSKTLLHASKLAKSEKRRKYAEEFSWEKIAEKYMGVFKKLINE